MEKSLILIFVMVYILEIKLLAHNTSKKYIFLGNHNIAPIIYLENSKPKGVVVDLTKALAEKSGLNIEIKALDWTEAQSEVLNEKADGLLQINPNKERENIYIFSKPLLKSDFSIFCKSSRIDIQNINSLFGLKVGVENRGYPKILLKKYPEIDIKIISSWKNGFELINDGELDALIVDRWVGEYVLSIHNIKEIKVIEQPIESSYSRIAIKKNEKELLNKINEGLDKIEKDGTRKEILRKWSKYEVVYITKEKYNYMMLFLTIALLILILFILIIFYTRKIKQINCELENLNNNLQQRVKEELQKRFEKEQLLIQQSKMASMGEMIGAIAHQWKQPLNLISILAQNIEEIIELENSNKKELINIQNKILEQVDFMDNTITDFRNFFTPSKNKKEFLVCESIAEVYKLLEAKIKNHNIELVISEHKQFLVLGCPNEFKQVILNIINNAIDVFINKHTINSKINILIENDGKIGTIKILDNGGGIPSDLLPNKIFEPYVTTKGDKGTGIGLQIAKTIIEQKMNGKIFASNSGSGAEFKIELPILSK